MRVQREERHLPENKHRINKISLAVSLFILISIISRIDREDNVCPVYVKRIIDYLFGRCDYTEEIIGSISISIVCYIIGSSWIIMVLILYLMLNADNVIGLFSKDGLGVMISVLVWEYKLEHLGALVLPSITPAGIGHTIIYSLKKRSIFPLVSALVLGTVLNWVPERESNGEPLQSLSEIHLNTNGIMIHTSNGVYSEYTEDKHGSGNRRVFGSGAKSTWKIHVDGLEGNPPPLVNILSGMIVHLQDIRTGEYLQTMDVASTLTMTNQEVSTRPEQGEETKFVLLLKDGHKSKGQKIFLHSSFFIKHVRTGVFITLLKRENALDGFEINGEKATGVDYFKGPEKSLWNAQLPKRTEITARNVLVKPVKAFSRAIKNYLTAILHDIREPRTISKHNLIFIILFLISSLDSVKNTTIRLEILTRITDLFFASILGSNLTYAMCCLGVTGIKYGLSPKKTYQLYRKKTE
ncbi:hypothetical protein NEOKW01_0628 [Nematocida sp. AWRm80]|nr:hypothetical protein NEOKW01_0628 [Nematocida sp. AWRm80]